MGEDTHDCSGNSTVDFSAFDFDGNISCGERVDGTTDGVGSHVGNSGGDHIYYFTVGQPGIANIRFNSCGSSIDTFLRIRSHDLLIEHSECDECCTVCPCGLQSVLDSGPLVAGGYALVVEGYGTAEGHYTVNMTCSQFDFHPTVLQNINCGATVTGDTSEGFRSSSTLLSSNSAAEHVYPFSIGPAGVDNVEFNSCNSTFDTYLLLTEYPDMTNVISESDDAGKYHILEYGLCYV